MPIKTQINFHSYLIALETACYVQKLTENVATPVQFNVKSHSYVPLMLQSLLGCWSKLCISFLPDSSKTWQYHGQGPNYSDRPTQVRDWQLTGREIQKHAIWQSTC